MEKATQTARTLLMVAVMIAAAIVPMAPEAVELRDEARAMGASISTDVTSLTLDEGGSNWYEVSLDEAPDGTLVITPSSDNSVVTLDPSYIKFTKVNWDMPQYIWVDIADTDDDGADTTATISHSISGSDTVFASASIGDVSVTGTDYDVDTDGDGLHDGLDTDDDGDGIGDDNDAFPLDSTEDTDTDGDGTGDNADTDDDGDGTADADDWAPLDDSEDTDTDGDGTGDNADIDADGDGVNDSDEDDGCDLLVDCDGDGVNDDTDAFDSDANESADADGDGIGDNADEFDSDATEDTDSDGDGVGDNGDAFPDDSTESADSDGDGVGDNGDAFPNDASETTDTDGDGVGDNSDWNATDSTESNDNDGDGVGDNADTDDDDDGVLDVDEEDASTLDLDGDGTADGIDCAMVSDCDGDGYDDASDAFDADPEAWDDFDGDGLADTFPNLLVQDSGNYGCDLPDSPSSWTSIECSFVLPDEGEDLLFTIDTDSWGYEAAMVVTDPDGVSTTYNGFASNSILTVTIASAAAGDWNVELTDSYGDGGTSVVVTYGSYTAGEAWLGEMIVPSTSGYGTDLDNDDDDDGFSDADEDTCGTDSMDATDVPTDTDSDGLCDAGVDDDDDDDGVLDSDEEAGCDLLTDCDGDGVGDATDSHDNDATETTDMDGDGIGDNSDDDRDGDGYLNSNDEFPDDDSEWNDNDGDGTGDNADTDDDTCPEADGTDDDGDGTADHTCGTFTGLGSTMGYDFYPGDGVADADDAFPMTPAESADNDGDGWGDNADADDDNDGISDSQDDDMDGDGFTNDDEDTNCVGDGGDSTSAGTTPDDMDGDGTCDYLDADTDGDGTDDTSDAYPEDACADTDTDGDGMPDTLVAGCTTTLTEDDDDDFDSSQAPSVTFTVTVSDDYSDGGMVAYVQVDGTTVCGPLEDDGSTSTTCDVTIYAGEVMEVSAECDYYDYLSDEGAITVSDGFSFSGAGDVTCYYAAGAGDYVIHTINGDDHITALTWTDADEATCGTDPLDSTDEPTDTDSDNLCDDAQDDDNDGDGFSNADETTNCFDSTTSTGTDPLDSTDAPTDTDDDGVCDYVDTDDDDDGVADADDAFPLDSTEDTDTDGDGTGDNTDTDDDGDGTADTDDAFPLDASEDTDTDGNGTGDNADTDDDGDGTADTDDAFPLDLCVDTDTDGDGIADDLLSNCVVDTTASGSGISSISIDATSGEPSITISEYFETNATDSSCDASISWHTYNFATGTWDHVDSSGLCNGDSYGTAPGVTVVTLTCYSYWGTCDEHDNYRATLTGNGTGVSVSYVGDFTVPDTDDDDDGDGVSDADDAFPLDSTETIDTDGDGTGDTADTDDDGDGVADADEADGSGLTVATDCTLVTDCDGDGVSDADEADGSALDLDGDGTADGIHCAVDTDCDDDGTTDDTDAFPIDATETSDMDGDGIGDNTDDDRDGDGLSNAWDACPDDSSGYTDTDGDGACDESDTDDDGDGTPDADDAFPLDASEDTDTDGDGVGDNSDADDDNDGTDDQGDECPLDASGITDNDSDGVCDVTDDDDDNDTVLDADEVSGCEFVADCDGDGVDDSADAFDLDPDASTDTDGDGLADTVSNTAFTSGTFNLSWTAGSMTYSVGIFAQSLGADGSTEEVCLEGYVGAGFWSQGAGYCLMDLEEGGGLAIQVFCPYSTCYSDVSVVDPAGTTTLLVNSSESPQYWGENWFLIPASAAGTQEDPDDDDDSYPDAAEDTLCVGELGDSLDDTVTPTDTDSDSICDYLDEDDDNDGYTDSHETADCGTDPLTAGDVVDTDLDGICNLADDDDDNDGVLDDDDWAPLDGSEWADTDGDGTGDNEDDDADGDGTPDTDDVDPTDRCSILDTDGDGLTDSYHDCSDMGFYSTLDSDAGDNAGEGFDDGDLVGITDDTTLFGGAAAGNQWFQVSDTDGVFRMYFDHATGVSAVSMWIALASTDYEEEDYYASYWVGDDGTTTELGNSQNSWGDIDNCWCEGFWGQWVVEVPSEDGYLMLEASNDDDAERWGLDNVAYHDSNWDVISMVTFEDSVGEMGVYTTPSSPALLDGTYTVQIDDSYGDGGHAITVTSGGTTLCAIADDYSATASCTFDLVAYSDEEIDISIDSDSWPYEGTLTVTFNDGSTAVETWSADTSFSYGHVGDALFEQEGDYSIAVSDSWGDGGHGIEAAFNGESVCSIAQDDYSSGATCTFTGVGFPDSVLTVDVDTDFYPSEGSMTVTFPDGTTVTETWSADTSFSYASHSGTDIVPVAGEVALSNGHGATVSLDTSSYHTGTVDDDDDNDGYADVDDAFPTDDTEWDDMDGDGVGSNTDNDDDGDGVNDGVDDFPRHAHATTDTDGDGMPNEIGMTDGEIGENFEIGNFSGMDNYTANGWARSGDANFGLASGLAFDGYAARAGIIDHNESSTMELTIDTAAGWVSFDYMVSTEERYDTLSFSIDGVEYMSASGQEYHWEFICTTAGTYSDTAWESSSLNEGSIPGNWVNDGVADCGDSDGDGTSDDEGLNNWYSLIEGNFETWVDEGTHTLTWTYAKDHSASAGSDRVYFDNIVIPYELMGVGECTDGTDDCNIEDMDDDADGVDDEFDDCPTDSGEQIDTDGDGYCDNADADDDNDGTYDYNDAMPLDPNETSDYDGDGIGDNADPDDDNDGCDDEVDDLPYDDSDCVDTDGDGVGDDADMDDDGDNVMDADDPFPLDGSAWADNDGDGLADVTGDPPFLGNFEGASIPAGWTTFGDANWFVCGMGTCGTSSGNAINGSYMAESGDINDAETSSIEISVDTLAGDVSFSYETSTETNWDYLRFYVDGSLTMSWSGVTSGTYTTTVSAGYHTFEWMYYKDFSVSSNADTVWIDDVSLPVSQVTNNSDPDDDNDGVYDEFDLDPLDPCVSLDTDGDGEPDWVMSGMFDMSGTGDEQFIVDCDASMWYEDWDDDGDGWGDEEEWLCGSNHLDADEAPYDMDQDWICDELDEDLDNDGAVNPVNNCELHLAYGDNASFVDCVADGFYAVDADGDGEASYMELMHAWTFQWPSDMDDEDDWDDEDDEDDWDDEDDGAEDMGGIGSRMGHENGTGDNGTGDDDHGDDHGDDNGTGDHGDDNGTGDHGDDNGTGDHGDDNGTGEEPEEPESWPSQEDLDAFDMMFWDWVSAWDADNSTSLSFDEFWQINADTWEGWDFENPGWSEDTTEWDQFPFDPSEQTDTDMDGMGDNSDSDDDNDGVPDGLDAFPYDPTESNDLDGDGIGDNSDNDVDGDGIDNDQDDFDSDPNAASDNDQDGVDDASDSDDDNDGVPDVADWAPLDASEQYDTDGDGVGDNADTDDDNDGTEDAEDAFPLDASENADADGDGVGDNSDPDDDNDGTPDGLDDFPYDATEQRDSDGDGIGDVADPDRDEDGYLNSDDAFPMNSNEWLDTDGDNIGDNSDSDIDGDSVLNDDDWAPLDSAEWMDTDGDGTGDNADTDDDGDTYSDDDEYSCGTDSKNANSAPSDFDGDGLCDALDPEDNRGQAGAGAAPDVVQESPGFTPGFASVLAVVSLLGAAALGRREED